MPPGTARGATVSKNSQRFWMPASIAMALHLVLSLMQTFVQAAVPIALTGFVAGVVSTVAGPSLASLLMKKK